jgi:hypothetical protein
MPKKMWPLAAAIALAVTAQAQTSPRHGNRHDAGLHRRGDRRCPPDSDRRGRPAGDRE